MRQELAGMLEALRITRDLLRQDAESVRGYLYPDGRAIARLLILPPWKPGYDKRKGSDSKVYQYLLDVEEAWRLYPAGTYFEASFLFTPESMGTFSPKTEPSHYNTLIQIQSYGTAHAQNLFATLRLVLWPKLRDAGYPLPSELLFRVGRSNDGSKPFDKKNPPIEKRRTPR
jgi:hypothetical protein